MVGEHGGGVLPPRAEQGALLQPREQADRARVQAEALAAGGRLQPDGEGQDARVRILEQPLDGGEHVVRADPDEVGQHDIAVPPRVDAAGAVVVRQQRRGEDPLQRAHEQKVARVQPHRADGVARVRFLLQDRAAAVEDERPLPRRAALRQGISSPLRAFRRAAAGFGGFTFPRAALRQDIFFLRRAARGGAEAERGGKPGRAHRPPSPPLSLRRKVSRSNSQ